MAEARHPNWDQANYYKEIEELNQRKQEAIDRGLQVIYVGITWDLV